MKQSPRVRKQSSPRLSTLAARLMLWKKDGVTFWAQGGHELLRNDTNITRHVVSLCASVLSQDEQPGQSSPAVRKRVRRAPGRRKGRP